MISVFKKTLTLIIAIFSIATASAKLVDINTEEIKEERRTFSVLYTDEGEAICVTSYNGTDVSNLKLPICNIAESTITDAVKPNGIDVAFLSHLGALVVGCGTGILSNILSEEKVTKENFLVQTIANDGTSTVVAGIISRMDPSGHVLAAVGGLVTCKLGSRVVRTFFLN